MTLESHPIRIYRYALLAAIAATMAPGQSNLGSIQGIVAGSDGTPLPGARVYAAVKAASQKTKVPPTAMSYVQAGAIAQPTVQGGPPLHAGATIAHPAPQGGPPMHAGATVAQPILQGGPAPQSVTITKGGPTTQSATKGPPSTFLISNLPAGSYVLCAQTSAPGWLDPCTWSASVPAITLAAGQNLTGQSVVMTKGAVVQIRIVDPSRLLSAHPGPIPKDVEVVAKTSNNAWYNAQLASTDSIGQYRQLTLPFDLPHTLIVRSQQFSLVDATGTAVPTAGQTQPLQISSSAVAPQFTYTVTGKTN